MSEIDQMRIGDAIDREDHIVAAKLFKIRTRLGIEREELAASADMSLSELINYENAVTPIPAAMLFVLSSLMGINVDCFFSEDAEVINIEHHINQDEEQPVLLS